MTVGEFDLPLEWSGDFAGFGSSVGGWDDDSQTDAELFQLPLVWSGLLEVIPPSDGVDEPFQSVARITMPTPVLVDGRPDATWLPTTFVDDWYRLRLVIGGKNRTHIRGKRFIPLTDTTTEPFGDETFSFILPGITEFENPASYGLTAMAPVSLRGEDTDGHLHWIWEGDVASIEADTGRGVEVHCVGVLYRVDLLKQPPALVLTAKDYGQIIAKAFNNKRARYNLNIGHMAQHKTDITGVESAEFKPFLTGTIQDYLAEMTTADGNQWTVVISRPRTPFLRLKDRDTVHATVSYGTPGVEVDLPKDFTTGITGVYGSGSNGHCTWMGARFPNLTQASAPAFPLAPGSVFFAGSGTGGFAPFAAFLRRGQYGTIVSGDTYAAADFDNVEQFQDRAGITIDGIVGAQTWEAAFQPGAAQGSVLGAYVDTVWELASTRRRLYNAQGADVGPNPSFNPNVPRIEEYVPFGDNVSKNLGRRSAHQLVSRSSSAGVIGTITLSADPEEQSRWNLRAGVNILVKNFRGGSVLVHAARAERNWETGVVTLFVDEKARDLMTAAAIHQRNRDVSDLTRRQHFGRVKSKVFDDYGTWLCEDGAGEIPLMNQQGHFWNVQRIAAGPKGVVSRISLALGSGLTESALTRNLGSNPPANISGAARGCILICGKPVTANQIANLPGMGSPLTNLGDGTNPWDRNQDALLRLGMVYAAGGPGAALGFYPNNDPGDGTSLHLSGRFEDGGAFTYGPTGYYWLWVAIWSPVSCKVGGKMFPGPPG